MGELWAELCDRCLARCACVAIATLCVWALTGGEAAAAGSRHGPALAPQLGRTIEIVPVSGRVRFAAPNTRAARLRSARLVPLRTTIDTRRGIVRVVSATGAHATETAEFSSGQFQATQSAGTGGALGVQLVGGSFAACHSAGAAIARPGMIRHLDTIGGYDSRVRTYGRYGGGSTRGRRSRRALAAGAAVVRWDTIDRCDGTAIVDQLGEVQTAGRESTGRTVPVRVTLAPDDTVAYRCGVLPGVSRGFCAVVHGSLTQGATASSPPTAAETLSLVTDSAATSYALNIQAPDSFSSAASYPLSARSSVGFRSSIVYCAPNEGRGTYQITWRINGSILATIDYTAPADAATAAPCTSVPFGRGIPADLTQSFRSADGHFLVHYTTDPGDVENASSLEAAQLVAQNAESALGYFTSTVGMPSFADDGDGTFDIYIERQTAPTTETFLAPPAGRSTVPAVGYPTAAFIVVPPSEVSNRYTLAFSLFGALRDALGHFISLDPALSYSTDAWAAANFTTQPKYLPALNQPLDCTLSCPDIAAYAQWRFYEHLAEKFGNTIVANILARDAQDVRALPQTHIVDALSQVLAAHGTSLAVELAQYMLEDLSAGWSEPWLSSAAFAGSDQGIVVSLAPAGQMVQLEPVTVNHLAGVYDKFTIKALRPCVTDQLTLQGSVPAGGEIPGAAVLTNGAYSVVGATATSGGAQLQVPFNSCSGATVRLPLINASTSTDGLSFTISGTLTRGSATASTAGASAGGQRSDGHGRW
jgi:hypothetical protein